MIPERLLNRSLTWIEPTFGTDAYGDDTEPTYGAGTTITGRIDPVATVEVDDQTRDLAAGTRLLITNTTGISSRARILDGSTVYEVDGLPAVLDDATGAHHTEARLRVVGG